jgi:superfamily II DNA or RNA helicase
MTASTHASPSPSTNFKIKLRAYQLRIVQNVLGPGNAKAQNALVLLPTSAGKTLVAAELIKRRAAHHVHVPTDGTQSSFKALFLVPSCFLVEQQAIPIRDWTGLRVGEYMGGQQLPSLSSIDVLVSTPEAFRSAQQKHPQELAWPNWGLVVFDEVHHVLKSHPYRKIARNIPTEACVQVVGLTASLTYAVTESKVPTHLGLGLCVWVSGFGSLGSGLWVWVS